MTDAPATEPTNQPARDVKPLPGTGHDLAGATENPPALEVKPMPGDPNAPRPAIELKPLPQ